MTRSSRLLTTFIGLSLVTACGSRCFPQSAFTQTQVWPEVDAHIQLPNHLRVLAFSGLEQGVGYPFQQWYAAAALGYQFKQILRPHLENIDPDKEDHFVIGGGYEYLRTIQSGKVKDENRLVIEMTPGFRPMPKLLLRDRNRIEFRWIDGSYSTTYRNMLSLEHDFLVHGFRFTPYASVEVFYDGDQHSWNEQWYTGGVQWPYRRLLMLDTYYRREHCSSCVPSNWNVAGLSLNFYFRNTN